MLGWNLHTKEHVGLFFVRKKGDKQRMIFDAQSVNERFPAPPAMQMTSPEKLSRLEAGNIDGLYVPIGDIDDCFRRLRVSREFSEWFALECVTAGELGALPLGRRDAGRVQHDHLAMLRNAANGILLAQSAYEETVRKAAGHEDCTDQGPARVVRPGSLLYCCYIDNFGFLSSSRELTDEAVQDRRAVPSVRPGLPRVAASLFPGRCPGSNSRW